MAAVSGESWKREELDAILSSYFQPPADRVLTLMLFVGPRFSVMSSQHLWVMNNKNRVTKKKRNKHIHRYFGAFNKCSGQAKVCNLSWQMPRKCFSNELWFYFGFFCLRRQVPFFWANESSQVPPTLHFS